MKRILNIVKRQSVFSALVGLAMATLLVPTKSHAQAICSTALSDGPTWLESKVHVGDTVHFIITLTAPNGVCRLRNGTNWVVTPDGVSHRIFENFGKEDCNLLQITCPSDAGCIASIPSTTISGQLVFSYGPIQAADVGRGSGFTTPRGTPVSLLGTSGFISVAAVGDAFTFDCASGTVSKGLATGSGNQPLQIVHPCIQVVKLCSYPQGQNCFQPGQDIQFTGYVTNCSPDISLTNVTIVDTRTGTLLGTNGLPLPQPLTLAIGQAVAFHGSFTPTLAEVCAGSATNKITVTGTDTADIPQTVTNSTTVACSICVNPCLQVTKTCTPAVVGQSQTVSGVVTNCGNIAITNVSITDNILGSITNFATLAPGDSFPYSKTFTATICGTTTNVVTAAGFTLCGTPISAKATNTCVVSENPCITVTKTCTPALVGAPQTISGVVSNCGNVTLTNIIVQDNIVGAITNLPTLVAGGSFPYSKTVPAVCGGNTNVVTASGVSPCGTPVLARATNVCQVTDNPCISVTKVCSTAVVGQPQTISGSVTNCGTVALTNVNISDNIVGQITNIPFLDVGGFSLYSKTVTASCGGNTNVVTASGTSPCGAVVQAKATNVCQVTENPCLQVTKICTPDQVTNVNGVVTFSGIVTNCGDVNLTNVIVRDSFFGNAIVLTVPLLAPGATAPYSTNYTTTVNDFCKTFTNKVTATGQSECSGRSVTNVASCSFSVFCPTANIGVTKEVACFIGTNSQGDEICDIFSHFALGMKADANPAFCYQITVTNPGPVDLTNVSVIDTIYGDLTSDFPCVSPVFPVGASCTFTFKTEVGKNQTNVVNIGGNSIVTGQRVTTNDNAVVKILVPQLECNKQYTVDGGPLTNNVTLPDSASHTIVWYVTVINPSSQVNLVGVSVADLTANLGCDVTIPPFNLDAGASTNFPLCTNTIACTNGFDGVTNTVSVTADHFTVGTNHLEVCAHDINGSNIVVSSECSASLFCSKPQACRVTGGGRIDEPSVFPHNVRYITHGGQVGAPVGDHICVVTEDFPIGNPCIHGRWTHVRHQQAGNEGNFHARFYDTLECACLDTNTTPVVVTIGNQTYTNLVYGPGTTEDAVCNPDDRASGPLPRPAPSNKIVFTGVGDYAETQGRRVPVSVLFRVDIEDRSEPGGSHPKGGTPPADRDRTRIWILTQSELAQLHGAGPDPLLLNFRNAISACNGIDVQDGATVVNGQAAFGVRAPDIDDGGECTRGNLQIHPSIKDCDPFNPTGPGLAKP